MKSIFCHAGAIILIVTLVLILAAPKPVHAAGTVRYASPNGLTAGNCDVSWANACTLQRALAVAVSGDEIWVKAGVHYPGASGNRSATFQLKSGVAIYGGFNGTETSRDQRNWQVNKTILSGDIDKNDNHGGDFINENASQIVGSNAYHVVTGSNTNSYAFLDGFIITAGKANGSGEDNYGGGMYNKNGKPTLTNLIFSGNTAYNLGGGMYNATYSDSNLTNVTFSGNTTTYSTGQGGGMYNGNSSPTLTNVIFSGNNVSNTNGYGGGMYNYYSSPRLTNVTFSSNSAYNHAGIYNYYYSKPTLTNVIIWGNTGGIFNTSGSYPSISYSLLQESGCPSGATCGSGMIYNTDPRFVDADGADNTPGTLDDNLRLSFGSPAIESGTNTGCPATDLDGLPRPADGNGDNTATCDMGAYEAGQMICNVAQDNTYTFNDQSGVSIEVSARGSELNCLYVDEMETNHPNATPGLQTGRYWLIRGLQENKQTDASGFTLSLTLPTTFTPEEERDKVCRYTGSGQVWDCVQSTITSNSITRNGITALSEWAVGNDVGPTAVKLRDMRATSSTSPFAWMFTFMLAIGLWMRKALPSR